MTYARVSSLVVGLTLLLAGGCSNRFEPPRDFDYDEHVRTRGAKLKEMQELQRDIAEDRKEFGKKLEHARQVFDRVNKELQEGDARENQVKQKGAAVRPEQIDLLEQARRAREAITGKSPPDQCER